MNTKIKMNLTGSNDIIFKAILLTNEHILKAILETLMRKNIDKFTILNSELPKLQFIEKGKRLDVYLETEKEYVDVEVSTGYSDSIQNRNLSYMCHIFCQAIKKGEEYSEYKKATIYNLIWNGNQEYIFQCGRLTDEYGNIMSDMITYNMIDMDKVMQRYYNKDTKFIRQNKYLIMLGLKLEQLEELIEIMGEDKIVMEYKETLQKVLEDIEIPPFVDKETDERMLIKGLMHDIEKEKQKALKKGMEKGIEQGMEKGEEKKKKEIAINLIKQGLDLENIAKATGLTKTELKHLI